MSSVAAHPSIEILLDGWRERDEISARSVLVTVLGDTVTPLGGVIWLADLIGLADSFGYNDRLVRTSMFRLAADGWVSNERVGRRSRYSLTDFGRAEIADASSRIYRRSALPWDGQWTLIFLAPDSGDAGRELDRHLRWHGFAQISSDVHAKPNADVAGGRKLLERLGAPADTLVASASFDAAGPADARAFRADSGLARAEAAYEDFVERYEWTGMLRGHELAAEDAFVLRTMIVHDLRRSRLADPELPVDLLPDDWIGSRATTIASAAYSAVDEAAWQWIESVTGLTADPSDPQLTQRFANPAQGFP
ncbi:MAG: PaaX family transcriptional regulator [Acidimicrobiales bacterium]